MHLVLAAAAADGALIACGGALDVEVDDPITDPSASSATSSSSGGSSSGAITTETQPDEDGDPDITTKKKKDAGADAKPDVADAKADVVDAKADVVVDKPDGSFQCVSGMATPSNDFCCAPGDVGCLPSNSAGRCDLDCKDVCAKVAPGVTGGWESCYWTGDQNKPQVGYMCGMCGVGRIPDGTAPCAEGDSVASRLAMQAYYEAVSVIAFERLADVLQAERAPRSLVRRVSKAAGDERRHADLFARLATERGAIVPRPEASAELPSLAELARENAQEGCVRETYGALVALHQAQHAEDPELRAAFAEIADDEVAHAALSWDLARWFEERLGEAAPVAEAIAMLREPATCSYDAVGSALGVPPPARARAMFDGLFARLSRPHADVGAPSA